MLLFQITEEMLLAFEKHDVPLAKANNVTSRLNMEVSNFSANNLVKLCDLCLKLICEQGGVDRDGRQSHSTRSHMWLVVLSYCSHDVISMCIVSIKFILLQ